MNAFRSPTLALCLGCAYWLLGCVGGTSPESRLAASPPSAIQPLIGAVNSFALRLFHQLSSERADRNIVIAPAGVAAGLFMAYDGAEGQTAREMGQVLGVQDLRLDRVNEANAVWLRSAGSNDPKARIRFSHSLWVKRGYRIRPEFIGDMKSYYSAQLFQASFDDPAAVRVINEWIKSRSNGEISRLIRHLDSTTRLLLIDAEYFKGVWTRRFSAEHVPPTAFARPRGAVLIPMMEQSGRFRYLGTEDFQAVELPYGTGRISMYVFLPSSRLGLRSFSSMIQPTNLGQWLGRFREMNGRVVMPRFRVRFGSDLKAALIVLGMRQAFGPYANFERIIRNKSIYIEHVWHESVIAVDEKGTQAGGASAVEFHIKTVLRPFEMVVDRPYFFVIRDNRSGLNLFMGSVFDPES